MKKIIFILALLLFSTSAQAISLNLSKSIYSQEEFLQGKITIDPGTYLASEKITITTGSSSKQLPLSLLIDCNLNDCTSTIGRYTTTGATELLLNGVSILTGFKINNGSIISEAFFDVSNMDANLPDLLSIDIGNDNSPEWIYPGYPTNNFPPISFSQLSDFEETLITENCQLFNLPKSSKYKIKAYVKKLPSAGTLDVYIPQIQKDGSCEQPTQSWGLIECNIDVGSPIDSGAYHICLTGSNNILATNSTSPNPNGYIGCSSGCTFVNKDYIMNFSAADFITTLDHAENFNTSNTKKDSFGIFKPLSDIINEYLENCPINENYCIVPINISSKNSNLIKISNLNYKETTNLGEILLKHGFLSYVEQQGLSNQVIVNAPTNIDLMKFSFEAPSRPKTYELQASFLSQTASKTYSVVEGPKVIINVSKREAIVSESIRFDASESYSPNNLTISYLWDFGDNINSTLERPVHSYSLPGTYVVELTVTDENLISSTVLKTITITGTGLIPAGDLLTQVDEAEQYFNTASQQIKDIYRSLNIDEEIKNAKTTLISSAQLTEAQVNTIRSKVPKSLSIQSSYDITPFITTSDLDLLLPLQEESFKETARTVNERIKQEITASLISLSYLSGQTNSFIVVRKTINVPQTIQNPVVIDLLPKSIATSPSLINFINPPTGQVTTFEDYQSIRISPPPLDVAKTNEIVYTISSSSIENIRSIKTLILPEDLSIALVPINCGDGICNPAEDINICPEDCRCGNNVCDLDETDLSCPQDCKKTPIAFFVSLLVILGIIAGTCFVFYKNPKLREQFKVDELLSLFKSKKSLMSESDLQRVVDFIKKSKAEGHVEKQIELSLLKKGWTKSQVSYAMKRAEK